MSQQGYANAIKGNYSHSGLPLAFYNYCWKAHKVCSRRESAAACVSVVSTASSMHIGLHVHSGSIGAQSTPKRCLPSAASQEPPVSK